MPATGEERTIAVKPGEEVTLTAPGEGVGGYSWSLEIDPAVGRLIAKEAGPPAEGFGGGAAALFRVAMTGRPGTARLVLKRSWEGEPERVITYVIRSP